MTGHYMKPAQEGKLYPCKKCGKIPTAGQNRYYEQIKIDGQDGSKMEVWVGCVDFECFKSQGGSAEPADTKKQFQSSKFKLEQAKPLMEMTQKFLDEFLEKYKPTTTPQQGTVGLSINEKAVFVESIFRTISQNFKP